MLKIKDLKKGEIYYGSWENGDKRCIFKQGVAAINSLDQFDNYSKEWCTSSIVTLRESTLGEKHWLNECIKANKFISYEEAMKTFKPQYIVNKWYKVKDWKFSYYVKFKSLEKVGYNKINGEIINAGTYKGDDYLANDQMEEKLELLEDLSEIQEFLPANHPDKVPTSLVGRYVKCLRDNANSCKVNDEWVRQAEYYQIGSIDGKYYKLKDGNYLGYIDRPDSQFKEKGFELMPVGFCPDNVIPEYVECLEEDATYNIKNRIYKVISWKENSVWVICNLRCGGYNPGDNLCNNDWFKNNHKWKISTKKAYDLQNSKQYPLVPKECCNTEIEIGDEVEVVKLEKFSVDANIYLKANIGDRFIVKKAPHNYSHTFEKGIRIEDNRDYTYPVECFKLIRKANNTTTLTQTKKDDVLSPKVENKVTVQIIERKIKNPILNISVQEENQSIFVPLIQKETKKINNITIKNFSLTV